MSRLSRYLRSRLVPALPPATPYEHLLTAGRIEPRTEQLFGEPFQIPDSISFYCSYLEICVDELYRFNATSSRPLIVDGGANCGLSVVYFKRLFPHARVIAVEPDPQIFALLEQNVMQFKLTGVTLINKAIAAGAAEATFYREGANAGRIHPLSDAVEQFTVPVVSLDDLLAEPVELLKLDIEGAEAAAIGSSQRLAAVSQLMVEYHSFADAPQLLPDVLNKLSEGGFRYRLQTQYCPKRPLVDDTCHLGMDFQLNIFAKRADCGAANGDVSKTAAEPYLDRSVLAA